MSINNLKKNVNLTFLRGIRFNISRLYQQLMKSLNKAAIPLRHLGKSILDGNLYFHDLGPLEIILRTLESRMAFRLPVITCPAGGYE